MDHLSSKNYLIKKITRTNATTHLQDYNKNPEESPKKKYKNNASTQIKDTGKLINIIA